MKTKMLKASRSCCSVSCHGGNAMAGFALQVSDDPFSIGPARGGDRAYFAHLTRSGTSPE